MGRLMSKKRKQSDIHREDIEILSEDGFEDVTDEDAADRFAEEASGREEEDAESDTQMPGENPDLRGETEKEDILDNNDTLEEEDTVEESLEVDPEEGVLDKEEKKRRRRRRRRPWRSIPPSPTVWVSPRLRWSWMIWPSSIWSRTSTTTWRRRFP